VDGLLHFSRKQISKEFKTVDLVSIIRETCQIVVKSFEARIEVQVDLPEHLMILGDGAGLSQVLMNLCTNARDAMPDGGCCESKPGAMAGMPWSGIGHGHRHGS